MTRSLTISFWRQAQAAVPVLALRSAEQLEGLEGIIVVFDLRQESSLDEVAQWAALVEDREECAFRVCVGSKLDLLPEDPGDGTGFGTGAETAPEPAESGLEGGDAAAAEGLQERRSRCLGWCLDHGFEYVEADCRDSYTGGELREKEGVPRIVEALQSNVWTGMEFLSSNRPSLMAAVATAAAGGSRNDGAAGDGGNVGGTGSVSGSSGGEDGTAAALSFAAGADGGHEASEYLDGFVDVDDEGGEYAGYGALDSGDEEEGGDGDDQAEGEGSRGGGGGGGGGGVEEGGAGAPREGRGGVVVDPSHIELQARWEQQDHSSSSSPGAGDATNAAAADTALPSEEQAARSCNDQQGAAAPGRDTAPSHDGGKNNAEILPSKPGDSVASTPADGTTAPGGSCAGQSDGGNGEGGSCRGAGAAAAGEGTGDGEAASKESEEYLLEAAGSMVGGIGGDLEGDEMERLMGEVRKARELGGSVSDEERRSRAANVAMRLAALLGDFGDDSGEDDSDKER
ncbi:IRC6, uncharacterised protein interacting with AP adaptor complexes [Ectocarpus siliculosus]|uniref:Uncharacterized protein n=1 Tax=Ectocarpus siliculosus TaxID=2880 RepID=D7FHG9_ECTSI|nr:IRC6, uncharacterised protein interacting with AP adaptor complexes [Ectocarpus siliculosus]|eukprot:CBJ28531.1 IRC6, uncharacterised protein interacting with AP adaptor complexes [Ectocarpus siliculosus]